MLDENLDQLLPQIVTIPFCHSQTMLSRQIGIDIYFLHRLPLLPLFGRYKPLDRKGMSCSYCSPSRPR